MAKLFDLQLVFTRMPAILSYLPVTLELVLLSTLFSAMAGYALSVYRFRPRNAIYNFVLMTMMIPCMRMKSKHR